MRPPGKRAAPSRPVVRLLALLISLAAFPAPAHASQPGGVQVSCCDEGLRVFGKDAELRLSGNLFTQMAISEQTDFREHDGVDVELSVRQAYLELFSRWKTLSLFVQGDFQVFSATVQQAWIEWAPLAEVAVRAGRDYVPFGLSQGIALEDNPFVERPLVTGNEKDLRDIGLWLRGKVAGSSLCYGVGMFNGSRDLKLEENETPDVAFRIAWEPLGLLPSWHGGILHVGASFRWGLGPSRQGYRGKLPTESTFFQPPEVEGEGLSTGAEVAWWSRWLSVFAEFQYHEQERKNITWTDPVTFETIESLRPLRVFGYNVGLTSLLWGREGESRGGFPPSTGLRPVKGVELAARFEELWVEDGAGPGAPVEDGRVIDLFAGLNVFPGRSVLVQAQYIMTFFDPRSYSPLHASAFSHAAILRVGLSL
jgi:phosphate-selective porin